MARKKKELRKISLPITGLTPRGNGCGVEPRDDGVEVNVEVPFTIPGDSVDVELLPRKRKGYKQGRLQQITQQSKDRIRPRCQHFGQCGGCRWQMMPYEQQLALKESMIKDLFSPFISSFQRIIPSQPWHYRNKMEFSFSENKEGERFLGMVLDSTRGHVFNLTECHLVNPWMADAVKAVRSWWESSGLSAYHMPKDTGSLRTLIVREGMKSAEKLIMLTVSGNPDYALTNEQIASLKSALRSLDENLSLFLRIQQAIKGKPTEFFEIHLSGPEFIVENLEVMKERELSFQVSPSAFFQPNTLQAEKLYSLALEMADIREDSVVYDLYCGTGTMGLCAATVAKEVVGIELSYESSLDARENAKRNNLDNITIHTGDVGTVLKELLAKEETLAADTVLLDPPRAGLDDQAIQHVLTLNPTKIVYVSCNPKTQAANMSSFIEAGYKLDTIQPVDQFPHTVHVENIALLSK